MVILLFFLLSLVSSFTTFDEYKAAFGKKYSEVENSYREEIFQRHSKEISYHNTYYPKWKLGFNQFTDMSDEEFRSLLRAVPPKPTPPNPVYPTNGRYVIDDLYDIIYWRDNVHTDPWTYDYFNIKSVDWRDKNIITPVKDQGMCGSCWAFSAAEGVESYFALKYGKLVELSEQQILDCTPNPRHCGGTGGCGGGTEALAYESIMQYTLTTEWRYPYTSYYGQSLKGSNRDPKDHREDGTCNKSHIGHGVNISGYGQLKNNDYNMMFQTLIFLGPIEISVDASSWAAYESGIFDGCNQTNPDLNHAVQLVGVGMDTNTKEEYWLIRNSWGTSWGENGYIRLKKNGNEYTCGLDLTPHDGEACDGEDSPVRVCGTCGMLYSGVFPIIA